ncbi:MAG TPA: hypothetical protein VLK27_00470 [Chthoniobacterales bacterium]|nr:hypothetical protein [Chthoniobacterales bacterium]
MNKSLITKLSLAAVVGFALTFSTARAGTMKPVSPSTNGFSLQNSGNSGPSLGAQLSLSGNGLGLVVVRSKLLRS